MLAFVPFPTVGRQFCTDLKKTKNRWQVFVYKEVFFYRLYPDCNDVVVLPTVLMDSESTLGF